MYNSTIIEKRGDRTYQFDVFSRLREERIVWIGTGINSEMAAYVIAHLQYLAYENETEPVDMYIQSPGGEIEAGLAIYDIIKLMPYKVNTIGLGMVASMGAFMLAAGTGTRYVLPSAKVMIHHPSGGATGKASDIKIATEEIVKIRDKMNAMIGGFTGKTPEQVAADSRRDHWFTADEAVAYGLADEIYTKTIGKK